MIEQQRQCMVQSAAVIRRQQVVLAAIVPTDLVCAGQYSRRHGPFPVRNTCVRAIPNLQRNERSRRTFIAWIFYHVQILYRNVMNISNVLYILSLIHI